MVERSVMSDEAPGAGLASARAGRAAPRTDRDRVAWRYRRIFPTHREKPPARPGRDSEVAHMTLRHALRAFPAATILAAATMSAAPTSQTAPLAMDTARVTIAGSSNIHKYSAWTDTVRVTRVKLTAP